MELSKEVLLQEIAGEYLLIPIGSNVGNDRLITLNESAVFLWKKLQEGCGKEQLAEGLVSEYAVDRENADADVAEFLAQLQEKGLLLG